MKLLFFLSFIAFVLHILVALFLHHIYHFSHISSLPLLPPLVHTPCRVPDGEQIFTVSKKKEADFSELIFFFPSSLSHFPDFPLPSSLFLPLSLPLVQYQMEMMRSLRHVNIDHLHVGWYQSTYYGSFVSRALLDSQFSYQHAIEESVVLIYGE